MGARKIYFGLFLLGLILFTGGYWFLHYQATNIFSYDQVWPVLRYGTLSTALLFLAYLHFRDQYYQSCNKVILQINNEESRSGPQSSRGRIVLWGLFASVLALIAVYHSTVTILNGADLWNIQMGTFHKYMFSLMMLVELILVPVIYLQHQKGAADKFGTLIAILIVVVIPVYLIWKVDELFLLLFVIPPLFMLTLNSIMVGNQPPTIITSSDTKLFDSGGRVLHKTCQHMLKTFDINILIGLVGFLLVPILTLYFGYRWWVVILFTIVGFFTIVFVASAFTHIHGAIVIRNLRGYIISQLPVDHQKYALLYQLVQNFDLNPYKSHNQYKNILTGFYQDLKESMPKPLYAYKQRTNALAQSMKKVTPSKPPTAPPAAPDQPVAPPRPQVKNRPQPVINAQEPPVAEEQQGGLIPKVITGATKSKAESSKKESRRAADAIMTNFDHAQNIRDIYHGEINHIASELRLGLSILVRCDKIITEYLWNAIIKEAEKKYELLEVVDLEQGSASLLHDQIRMLRKKVRNIENDIVLIIPHLDLLAGGSMHLSDGARELTQLLYRNVDSVILAFADVSFDIPEILSSRFSLQKQITGVPRFTPLQDKSIPTANLMLTKGELSYFEEFDSDELYRVISGMNPLKIRQAVTYAINERKADEAIKMEELKDAIRIFKSKTSTNFSVPDVGFEDIGGYAEVKVELEEAVALIQDNSLNMEDALRQELIPKGFIFYGPPGTGKTLFAKAVANKLNANVMVVSGPEVITMWVGESERKIRETFAEARRNAPSVLVFDEFDSIATKRSSESHGSARVGNSMVAQILTEMDGFRPDVPVLVIGTTNRLDIIDEALLRPSRFKPVAIELPDKEARRAIARIYAEKFEINLTEEVITCIADSSVGFNGDEIQSIFRNLSLEIRMRKTDMEEHIAKKLGRVVGKIKYMKEKQSINSLSVDVLPSGNTYYTIEID